MMKPDERITLEKFAKLDLSLDSGKSEVEIIDVQCARVTSERTIEAHPVARVKNAATLLWRHGDVDVGRLCQRETAQDGVP